MTNSPPKLAPKIDLVQARAVLSARGWLTKTPASFREAILSGTSLHHFAEGETIYAQGDRPAGVWGLAQGLVGIELSGQHRDPTYAFFASKGFWIGAHTLVMPGERQVGLVALRPSALLHLPAQTFHALSQTAPEAWRWLAVLPLLQNVIALGTLQDLMLRDPEKRVAAILLRLAGCRGPMASADPDDIFVTQEQLAEMISISRTALGRILRMLQAEGAIARQYGRISIDPPRLLDLLGEIRPGSGADRKPAA